MNCTYTSTCYTFNCWVNFLSHLYLLVFSMSLVKDKHRRQMVSQVAPHFSHLNLINAIMLFMMAPCDVSAGADTIMWHQHWDQWCHWPKFMSHLVLIIWTYQMQWCHWWWSEHHVMLMQVLMASSDWKSHVAPCFDCLDLTDNADIDNAIGITCFHDWWHHMSQKSYHIMCQLSPPNKQNGAIDDAIGITWCWH